MAGRNSYDLTVERGIKQRHEDRCNARDGKRCTCRLPAFIASATVTGKRLYSPTLRSLDAARGWRRSAITGELPNAQDATGPTLEDVWRDWVRAAEKGIARTKAGSPYRPRALRDYDSAMTNHVLPRIGPLDVSLLDAPAVQRLLDQLAEAGVSPSRQHASATALRAMTRWSSRRGVGQRVVGLELPRVTSRTPGIRTPAEIAKLVGLVGTEEGRLFAALAAYAGARASEIAALEQADVDLEAMTLRLGEHEDGRKTASAVRTVPILKPLAGYLASYPAGAGPLFRGAKVRTRYDRLYLATRTAWVDFDPRPTPHTLRHNWVSWMLAAGVPLPAAQRLAGHKTPLAPGVTLAVYGHATDDHVERARDTMNTWLTAAD